MLNQQKRLFAIFVLFTMALISASTHAWDITPLEVTGMEGENAVINIIIQSSDWVFNGAPCDEGEWGVEFSGIFEDGTAIWGEDIEKDFEGNTINGVCASQDPTGDSQTTVPLTIIFLEDLLVEETEQATLEFEYCSASPPLKNNNISTLEETCIQRIVTLTVQDSDLDVFIDIFTANPETILATESTTLFWLVGNAVECEASGGAGGWSGTFISLPEGSKKITLDDEGSYEFVLTCTGAPEVIEEDIILDPKVVSRSVTVIVEFDPSPDLDVFRVSLSSTVLEVGETFSIDASIRNEGAAPSTTAGVKYLLSTNNLIEESDDLLAETILPPLEAGELIIDTGNGIAPGEPGRYWVGACAERLPDELDYRNNCSRGTQISVSGDSCLTGELACGQTVSGAISSLDCNSGPRGQDHFAKPYELDGQAGDTVWFDVLWSFDGYLSLEGPDGLIVAQNDNFTSAADSQIEYTFSESGAYTLWLSSFAPNDVGDFELLRDCDGSGGPDLVSNIPADGVLNSRPAESISLQVELFNVGDLPADSSTLRWLLSSDSQINMTDTQLASMSVASLAADGSRLEAMELLAPATPGTFWIGTCVDEVAGESATTNNCSNALPMTVSEPPVCFSTSLSCGGAVSGQLNSNDCSSGPRGAGYYAEKYTISATRGEPVALRSDWTGVDGMLYLVDPLGNVVAQNDDNLDSRDPQSLIEFVPSQSGVYSVWATTFPRNQSGSFSLSAECGASSAPDLVTTASLVSDAAVTVGGTVMINYTITNAGNGPADGTTILMCLSKDPVISLRDSLLDTDEIGALAAGESITLNMEVTVPSEPGDYWVGPCAKAVNGEAVTGNNCTLPTSDTQFLEAGTDNRSKLQASGDGGLLLNVSSGSTCTSQVLSCGQSQQGTLQSSDCDTGPRGTGYVSDAYTFSGSAGATVTLDATWNGVDGYLYLESPTGTLVGENDDFEGKAGSRIEMVLDQSGSYTVWPTAFGQGDDGGYALSLACNQPKSPDLEVDQPELSATTFRPGQSLLIRTRTRNKGGFPAGSSAIDFIISATQDLTAGTRVLKSGDVPALEGGASTEESALVELSVTPGNYFIGSCVDVEASELDTDNNCNVSGPITVEATNEPIAINTGLNDAWYNPTTDGQGFFINVFPDTNLMFLSWFTFDTERPPGSVPFQLGDPGHRWLTAQGVYDQGVAELAVFLTAGGVFDATQPAASPPAPYGNMTVSFSDCNTGAIDFDLNAVGETGSIPITRVVNENVAVCEQQLGGVVEITPQADPPGAAFNYNQSLNDAWYNPATNGQGFFFNVYPELEFVFLSWFTYDVQRPPQGTPFNLGDPGHRWLTAQGNFSGDTANLTVNNTSGGVFNAGSLPPGSTVEVGNITATFDNCNSGTVSYNLDLPDVQGEVPIERIARDTIPACEQQSKGGGGSTEGISPEKETLENLCNGSVDWHFEWPDVDNAGYYWFELYRNDSLEGSPRATGFPSVSQFDYSGKEAQISQQNLDNWKWRYRPVLNFGKKGRVGWSEFFEFNVRPLESPCAN